MTETLPTRTASTARPPDTRPERILDDLGSPGGPLLLVTFQIHGNEPAGHEAVRDVLQRLAKPGAPPLAGRLVAVRGNLAATDAGVRRLDHDLNRVFPPGPAAEPPAAGDPPREHAERDALVALIAKLKAEHPDAPLWFLDLHTTSSESVPYLSLPSDDAATLLFAGEFPLHQVTGFPELVPGTIDRYLFDQGFIGFVCEGGRHDHHSSVSNLRAVLWLMLEKSGLLQPLADGGTLPEVADAHLLLEKFLVREAAHFRITHRHAVGPDDGFRMEPGFANFSQLHPGQVLAHDRNGPILSPDDSHILMPLYQPSGADGFFLVREEMEPPEPPAERAG